MSQWLVSQIGQPVWLTNTTTGTTITYPFTTTGSLSEPESESPMTTITDLAALEAVPLGHNVRVDSNDWVRTEKGLARDGADLPLFHFEGRVLQGAVIDVAGLPPAAGEWWAGNTRTYYLYRVTDQRVYYTSFRSNNGTVYNWTGDSRLNTWNTSATLHRLTGAPSILENSGMALAAVAHGTARAQLAETNERLVVAQREVAELREQTRRHARKPETIRASIANIRNNLDQIAQLLEE